MSTIKEMFHLAGNPSNANTIDEFGSACFMGLEIEVENYHITSDRLGSSWSIIRDASLRNNGAEFVLRTPHQGRNLLRAINELDQHLQNNNHEFSHRCSVHCHIDFRGDTLETVRKFFKLYMLLEPSLYTISSKDRYMNIYCPGLTHATHQIMSAGLQMRSEDGFARLVHSWCKYTGINLHTLTSLGTIEIRTHQGTANREDLIKWVRILNYIKTSALFIEESWIDSVSSPQELVDMVFPEDLREEMFTDNLVEYWKAVRTNLSYFKLMGNVVDKMPEGSIAIGGITSSNIQASRRTFNNEVFEQRIAEFINQSEG